MSTLASTRSQFEKSFSQESLTPQSRRGSAFVLLVLSVTLCAGCGTTRWTDTGRTATEQLLISDAVDRAVQSIDFTPLSGEKVYFEEKRLKKIVDQGYVASSLRQHLLASGCALTDEMDEADYIVEARAGAVGTDRHNVLYGIPATSMPMLVNIPGVPSQIPEIPFAKRTDQLGVAKLAVFAFERKTGHSVWQSGVVSQTSRAKDFWLLGAGPFQKGTIYSGTAFAGQKISNPLNPWNAITKKEGQKGVPVTASAVFLHKERLARSKEGALRMSYDEEGSKPEAVAQKLPSKPKDIQPTKPQQQDDTPRLSFLPPVIPAPIRSQLPGNLQPRGPQALGPHPTYQRPAQYGL